MFNLYSNLYLTIISKYSYVTRCVTCANYYLHTDFNLPLRTAELAEAGAQPRVWGGRMGEETQRATIAVLHDTVFCEKAQLGQNGTRRAKDGGWGRVLLSDCELYSSVFSRI